jgi:hypothetical protein
MSSTLPTKEATIDNVKRVDNVFIVIIEGFEIERRTTPEELKDNGRCS